VLCECKVNRSGIKVTVLRSSGASDLDARSSRVGACEIGVMGRNVLECVKVGRSNLLDEYACFPGRPVSNQNWTEREKYV
jgi:hypothetical protein